MKALLLVVSFVFSFLGPVCAGAQTLEGVSLPPAAAEFLLDLVSDAGLESVRVTSFERTARRQAELMYDLLEDVGIGPVRDLYESIGDAAVDFYERNRAELDRRELIRGMEEVITALVTAAPDREQMMHVLPTKNYTFDVAPSSVAPNEAAFTEAIRGHGSGPDLAEFILPGPAERAFHLEVPRTLRTVSGRYSGECRADNDAVALTLVRGPGGYRGQLAMPAGTAGLEAVEVARIDKTISLRVRIDETAVSIAGRFAPDYSTILFPAGALGTCRLDRVGD